MLQFLGNFFREFPGSLSEGFSRQEEALSVLGVRKDRFRWHLRGRRRTGRWIWRRRVGHKYFKGSIPRAVPYSVSVPNCVWQRLNPYRC